MARRLTPQTKAKDAAQTGAITAETAAKLLMISVRHLYRIAQAGWIQKTPDDRYTVVGCVQGYIKFLMDENRRSSKQVAAGKLVDARSTLLEVQTIERTGELTRRARLEALAVIDEGIGTLRANLLSVPARCTMDLKQRQTIEAEIEDVLRQAVGWAEDQRRSAEAVRAADTADPEDSDRELGEVEQAV